MIKQILAFTNPARLSTSKGLIVIDTMNDREITTRPIEDIGIVVIESHRVLVTAALLSALLDNNVAVIFCNAKHMPSGLLLPISGNSLMTERLRKQIGASQPLRKQLWQQTVSAKITNQGRLLRTNNLNASDTMEKWAKLVRSGDPDNLEARAAIFYWKNLFPDNSKFKRGNESDETNSLLDYGYAILRAIVARAIVSTGLMPQIGLFHTNKYNAYCLADDIMEPYRPYVDQLVCQIKETFGTEHVEMSTDVKRRLLELPVVDVVISGKRRPLLIAATMTVASLWKCYNGELRKISYPEIQCH